MAAKGQLLAASPLHPVATRSTVRVRDGHRQITAGPFAETTEQLGGYYLMDVKDLEEAIAIASRLPGAKKGTVEIRPIFKLDGLPTEKLHLQPDIERGLTKFMFLCYDDEEAWTKAGPEAQLPAMQEAVALTYQIDAKGQYLIATPLHPSSVATSVRIRNGRRIISDGPFAETREVLGDYYLLLAKDREEALEYASQHPGARVGSVEVRQVFDISAMQHADVSN